MTLHSVALNCCFVTDMEAASPLSTSCSAADPFSFNAGNPGSKILLSVLLEGARSGLLRQRQRCRGEGGPVRKMEGWEEGGEEDTAVKAAECERILRQKIL